MKVSGKDEAMSIEEIYREHVQGRSSQDKLRLVLLIERELVQTPDGDFAALRSQVPDLIFEVLSYQATQRGESIEGLMRQYLEDRARSELARRELVPRDSPRDAALRDLQSAALMLRHFGSFDAGRPLGTDNDEIDRDLAREYAGGD